MPSRASFQRLTQSVACCALLACAPSASVVAARSAGFHVEKPHGQPPGHPVEDDRQWILSMIHVHSTEGPWRYSSRAGLDTAANANASAARKSMRTAASRGVQIFA